MKKKILFVDDEPMILQGIERMLREKRHEWEMRFAEGGPEALEILETERFDVVVSDLRMAGMDGRAFLSEVMNLHPETMRIVLTAQASPEATLRCIGLAHQFLYKPCDAVTLKATIDRACILFDFLADEPIRRVVTRMDSCPSLPSLYAEVMKELQSPDASIQRVGKIVSRDVGMTAKVLQLVNSAFFGFYRHISDPVRAVVLIGSETLTTMILTLHIFSAFGGGKWAGFSLDQLWEHSMSVAAYAKFIAGHEGKGTTVVNDSFAAGLLHDLGKLILANHFSDRYERAVASSSGGELPLWRAELEEFGVAHSEVGAYLMGIWGLPHSIIEALAFHHCPELCADQAFSPLSAVRAADLIAHEGPGEREELGPGSAPPAGPEEDGRLPKWREICLKAREEGRIALFSR